MKSLRRILLLALVVSCVLPVVQTQAKRKAVKKTKVTCTQGTAYRSCPACGTAKSANNRTLNVQKNRGTAVTHPQKITVEAIRDPANNTGVFTPTKQVFVTGYVASVDPGGNKETCNCGRNDLRDVHINIVADPSEANDKTKYVVVEFTPRWEKRFGFDDS